MATKKTKTTKTKSTRTKAAKAKAGSEKAKATKATATKAAKAEAAAKAKAEAEAEAAKAEAAKAAAKAAEAKAAVKAAKDKDRERRKALKWIPLMTRSLMEGPGSKDEIIDRCIQNRRALGGVEWDRERKEALWYYNYTTQVLETIGLIEMDGRNVSAVNSD